MKLFVLLFAILVSGCSSIDKNCALFEQYTVTMPATGVLLLRKENGMACKQAG